MRKIFNYFDPIAHLGNRKYSLVLPFLATLVLCILSEIYACQIMHNPMVVGTYIIFLNVAFILYFSFRDGIRGGFISSAIAVLYYFYIIYTRHFKGEQLSSGVDTTIVLGVLYLVLAGVIGWLKQTIDILIERATDEKKRMETIIQQLPVGVIITDNHGQITQINKQVHVMLGAKLPLGFTIGKDTLIDEKINGEAICPSKSPLYQALSAGKPVVGKEFDFQRKDGKHVYLRVSAAPVHNNKGNIIAAASLISDITQQKELEARKDDFVNMASHELKTPITSMKLYLDFLTKKMQGLGDASTAKALTNIKNQTQKLQDLVDDLLDVSRLQTGKLMLKKETFLLNTLIEEIIEALQGATRHQKLIFKKKGSISVSADRFRIYQVLTNLVTNAIKYSPEGSDIIISTKKEKDTAIISVQDVGIGIAKDQQEKVFERLYQVTEPTEKTFPGLGMGLYISKEIVTRHHGKMWIESEKGKGSTFFFSLPIGKKTI